MIQDPLGFVFLGLAPQKLSSHPMGRCMHVFMVFSAHSSCVCVPCAYPCPARCGAATLCHASSPGLFNYPCWGLETIGRPVEGPRLPLPTTGNCIGSDFQHFFKKM